jgi:uncharacterized protein (DUF885 family)
VGDAVVRLADELFATVLLAAEPLSATVLGFHEGDDRLTDYSEAGDEAIRGRVREIVASAATLVPDALDREDRATRAVVLYQADAMLARLAARRWSGR